jgi:hypothetical protein
LATTVSVAIFGVAIAESIGTLAPALAHALGSVAAIVLVGMVGQQLLGVRVGSAAQEWTSAAKALGFMALVAVLSGTGTPRGNRSRWPLRGERPRWAVRFAPGNDRCAQICRRYLRRLEHSGLLR